MKIRQLINFSFLLTGIGFCNSATAQNCCPRITNGLIAYYPFCGNADDASINGYNGTVFGATLTTDRFGNPNSAYQFNGSTDYISVADNSALRLSNTDFTISAWIYETSVASGQDVILSKRSSSPADGYILNVEGNVSSPGLLNYQVSGSSDPRAESVDTIPLSAWKHVVITYSLNSQAVNIYIDGILNSTTTNIPTPNPLTVEDLWIGNDVAGAPYSFHGKLDDISIYNRILNALEIQQLELDNKICDCLIAYYPFTGNAADSSGNHFDGTVYGATLSTDRFGNLNSAYEFNGVSDYISIPDTTLLRLDNTDFTISALIYETTTSPVSDAIVSKRTSLSADGYILNVQGNFTVPGLVNYQVSGGADPRAISNDSIQIKVWQNVLVAYTLSSQTVKIYIDGVLNSTTTGIPSPNALTTANLWIGNDVAGAPYSFHGKIDDVRIYNCALSDSEISILYNPPTAINETAVSNNILIYPQPASDLVHIDFENSFYKENYLLIVKNILGETVYQSDIKLPKNIVNVNQFNGSGIYIVNVISQDDGFVIRRKINIIK